MKGVINPTLPCPTLQHTHTHTPHLSSLPYTFNSSYSCHPPSHSLGTFTSHSSSLSPTLSTHHNHLFHPHLCILPSFPLPLLLHLYSLLLTVSCYSPSPSSFSLCTVHTHNTDGQTAHMITSSAISHHRTHKYTHTDSLTCDDCVGGGERFGFSNGAS